MLERQSTHEHRIKSNSCRPDIYFPRIIPFPQHHLRRSIARRSTGSLHHRLTMFPFRTQPEINQLQFPIPAYYDVLRLNISMCYFPFMQEPHSLKKLAKVFVSFINLQFSLSDNQVIQFLTLNDLCEYGDVFLCLLDL